MSRGPMCPTSRHRLRVQAIRGCQLCVVSASHSLLYYHSAGCLCFDCPGIEKGRGFDTPARGLTAIGILCQVILPSAALRAARVASMHTMQGTDDA